jgi:hypothetical protein
LLKALKLLVFNDDGIMTGAKPRIMCGIAYQIAVHEEILNNFAPTHPVGSVLCRNLLQWPCKFNEVLMTTMDTIWTEYQARYGELMPTEAFTCPPTLSDRFIGNSEIPGSIGQRSFNSDSRLNGSAPPGGTSYKLIVKCVSY